MIIRAALIKLHYSNLKVLLPYTVILAMAIFSLWINKSLSYSIFYINLNLSKQNSYK